MNIFKNKTVQISALIAAMGLVALPYSSAQALGVWWPGGNVPVDPDDPDDGTDPSEDYTQGFEDGTQAGIETCQDSPSVCGISLQEFLDNTGFGETEPNDKAFSADGLVLGENYHANSFDYFDEDWYYVQTTANNQNITVSFLGDNESSATEGWLISVRDSAGNILATFDSTNPGTDDGGDAELFGGSAATEGRTIVVTVGNPGSYYITVQPFEEGTGEAAGTYKAYSIAALLSDPGQTSPNPDSNFMDVELEPNDTRANATALSSTTNMFAYFDKVAAAGSAIGAFNFDTDWFRYTSDGNEIFNLRMCSRESCGRSEQPEVPTDEFQRIWHLQITDEGGRVLVDGPIKPGQAVNSAITFEGDYYVRFSPEATGEVQCLADLDIKECPPNLIVPTVFDASGAYNFTVTGTSLSPTTP